VIVLSERHHLVATEYQILIVVALCYAPVSVSECGEYAVDALACCDGGPPCEGKADVTVECTPCDAVAV